MLRALAAAGLIALAACQPTGQSATGPAGASRAVPILDGQFRLGVPGGFCIDRNASQQGRDRAVMLMGRCSSISAPDPAILTVSVGPAGSASVLRGGGAELAGLFASDRGRAMLARSGKAGDLRVLSVRETDGIFLLNLSERGQPPYWRAISGAHGRLVTVSATGSEGLPLPPDTGRALVTATMVAIRGANAATP